MAHADDLCECYVCWVEGPSRTCDLTQRPICQECRSRYRHYILPVYKCGTHLSLQPFEGSQKKEVYGFRVVKWKRWYSRPYLRPRPEANEEKGGTNSDVSADVVQRHPTNFPTQAASGLEGAFNSTINEEDNSLSLSIDESEEVLLANKEKPMHMERRHGGNGGFQTEHRECRRGFVRLSEQRLSLRPQNTGDERYIAPVPQANVPIAQSPDQDRPTSQEKGSRSSSFYGGHGFRGSSSGSFMEK